MENVGTFTPTLSANILVIKTLKLLIKNFQIFPKSHFLIEFQKANKSNIKKAQ